MAVTASFRILYIRIIMEVGTRKIVHFNWTGHPTSEWTLQQFRKVIQEDERQRYLIHDRDSIYSAELDSGIQSMGLKILKTPERMPTANAYCERILGTIRWECLDFMIPLNERHLRSLLKEWKDRYNRGRHHLSRDRGFLMLTRTRRLAGFPDMRFRVIPEWLLSLSWVGCIMNIDSRRLLPENRGTVYSVLVTFLRSRNYLLAKQCCGFGQETSP